MVYLPLHLPQSLMLQSPSASGFGVGFGYKKTPSNRVFGGTSESRGPKFMVPFRKNPIDGCMRYLADHPNIWDENTTHVILYIFMYIYNIYIYIPKDPWASLVYLATWMVDFYGINVGKYAIVPMDPLGFGDVEGGTCFFPVVPLVFRVCSFGWCFQ